MSSTNSQAVLESIIGSLGASGGQAVGSARGRRQAPLAVEFVRELDPTGGDLALVQNPPPQGSEPPAVKSMRHTHHMLAKLLAEGRKAVEVSEITGYSQSRISILKNDPAFQELIDYYRGQAESQFVDVHKRLAALGTDVIEVLQERLSDSPEEISMKTLLAIGEFALDRSVAPPKGRPGTSPGGAEPGASLPVINITFNSGGTRADLPPLPIEGGTQPLREGPIIEGEAS